MPELPEVETVVSLLKPIVVNNVISACSVAWYKTFNLVQDLIVGQKIVDIFRRGKYIILKFKKSYLVIHLRMTGKLFVVSKNDFLLDSSQKHLRVSFELKNKVLLFQDQRKFGRINLHQDLDWLEAKLGPEPLAVEFKVQNLISICKNGRQIKVLLLDQSKIAGLGNIYVDEVLWFAGVHPQTKACDVALKEIKLMHRGIKDILNAAIKSQGTTFLSYTFEGDKEGSFVSQLKVFNRAKMPCFRCGLKIIKIKVGQRGTHVCIACQPKPVELK
jgi:formamidopyrimidine-DNA glycosylase